MRLVAATLPVMAALVMAPSGYARTPRSSGARDPIIFVHGFEGSGGQFESQQLRFVENGYPSRYVRETDQTWPLYQALGFFISSVDVFAPAHSPPTGVVTVGLRSRGAGPVRKVSFPGWPGTTDVVTAQFDDWDSAS